jgi:hypothetical protein
VGLYSFLLAAAPPIEYPQADWLGLKHRSTWPGELGMPVTRPQLRFFFTRDIRASRFDGPIGELSTPTCKYKYIYIRVVSARKRRKKEPHKATEPTIDWQTYLSCFWHGQEWHHFFSSTNPSIENSQVETSRSKLQSIFPPAFESSDVGHLPCGFPHGPSNSRDTMSGIWQTHSHCRP